jgi:hypothetical protein
VVGFGWGGAGGTGDGATYRHEDVPARCRDDVLARCRDGVPARVIRDQLQYCPRRGPLAFDVGVRVVQIALVLDGFG